MVNEQEQARNVISEKEFPFQAIDERDVFAGHSHFLQGQLAHIGLDYIKVLDEVSHVESYDASSSLTLGIIGGGFDQALSILAASEGATTLQGMPIKTLLILPTQSDGLPITFDENGLFAVNSFFTYEKGIIAPVKTHEPIPLDGILPIAHWFEQSEDFDRNFPGNVALERLVNDKVRVKSMAEEVGIAVPAGTIIRKGGDVKKELKAFVAEQKGSFVVKANDTNQGKTVEMFGRFDLDEAVAHASALLALGHDVIVEKRVRPFPLFEEQLEGEGGILGEMDWNMRLLVTYSENPEIVTGEVRFGPPTRRPINISHGAKAVELSQILSYLPEGTYNKISSVLQSLVRRLYRDINGSSSLKTLSYVGVDLMLDSLEQLILLEANAGHVGGFGTISKLTGQPISAIREVLIPSMAEYLYNNFCRRGSRSEAVEQLGMGWREYSILSKSFICKRNFFQAEQALRRGLEQFPEAAQLYIDMGVLFAMEKKGEDALSLFLIAFGKDKKNPILLRSIPELLSLLGRPNEAAVFVDTNYKESGIFSPNIIELRARIELTRSRDLRKAIELLYFYDKDYDWSNVVENLTDLYASLLQYTVSEP